MTLHADFETFSLSDLTEVGAYRYAESPSTEILLLAVASETEGPFLWVNPLWRQALASDPRADELIARASQDPDCLIYAHNAGFERAVSMYVDGPLSFMRQRPHNWRCTAAMCRKAAIPDSLEKSTAYLGLSAQKDTRGKALIRMFSMLQTKGKQKGQRIKPTDAPDAFKEFGDYCLQDVRAEMELHQKLKPFELKGTTLDTFLLDITINDRGIPVNVAALRNAKVIVDDLTSDLHAKFQALTGLAPTQKQAVKDWLGERGCALDDMKGDTVKAALKGSTGLVAEVLGLYLELNYSAVKKVESMLDCVNRDGRVRGTLLYHGASTGRWSGRLIQPQNFKKPTIKSTGLAYQMLCDGASSEDLDLLFGNPLEAIASSVRHFIDAGEPILDADYAGIEARIVCWLAGQEDALQRFRDGVDSYKVLAAMVYNMSVADIANPSPERDLGKEGVLGGGFGMGAGKFFARCHQKGLTFVTQDLADRTVAGFRAMHPEVVKLWYAVDKAARRSIAQPGTRFNVGDKLSFICQHVAGKLFMFMRLPSGRSIAYAEPKVEILPPGKVRRPYDDEPQITFYGKPPDSAIWCRVKTYGACLVENCLAGDTLILSKSRGWIRLDSLESDQLWDGQEWVSHRGLISKGEHITLDVHGVRATPDHLFMDGDSWVKAETARHCKSVVINSDNETNIPVQSPPFTPVGSNESTLRLDDRTPPSGVGRKDLLGSPLRLWTEDRQSRLGSSTEEADWLRLRLSCNEGVDVREDVESQDEPPPLVRGVVFDETSVPVSDASCVAQLRRSRDHGLPRVVRFIRELLAGYGARMAEGLGLGSDQQRGGVLGEQLSLDYPQGELPQQAQQRGEPCNERPMRQIRHKGEYATISPKGWVAGAAGLYHATESAEHVYDIRNCGPRFRFVVKSPATGCVMIAHNCTQAVAADLMSHGACNAERANYRTFTLIHDQSLCHKTANQTPAEFVKLLTDLPHWAKGLPLAAECKVQPYYRK